MSPTSCSRAQIVLHSIVVLVAVKFAFTGGVSRAYWEGMEAGSLTVTAPASPTGR